MSMNDHVVIIGLIICIMCVITTLHHTKEEAEKVAQLKFFTGVDIHKISGPIDPVLNPVLDNFIDCLNNPDFTTINLRQNITSFKEYKGPSPEELIEVLNKAVLQVWRDKVETEKDKLNDKIAVIEEEIHEFNRYLKDLEMQSFYNPLETFNIFFENFSNKIFDNLSFNIFFNFFLIILVFYIFYFSTKSIFLYINIIKVLSNVLQIFFSTFKNFLKNLRFERFFFFLIILFVFILFTNFGGLSLYELSFTSHAVIALFLSFILFFNFLINIFINFNEKIYEKFVLNNLNANLKIILFLIEFVSFFIRPFSLGIRLFANVLSGHILIHIFFNAFIYMYKIIFWLSFLLLAFCFFILFLEIFVACVQSYIFLILSFIYLQDVAKLHV